MWLRNEYLSFRAIATYHITGGIQTKEGRLHQVSFYKLIYNSMLVISIDQIDNPAFNRQVLVIRVSEDDLLYAKIVSQDPIEVQRAIHAAINVQGKVNISQLKEEQIEDSALEIAIMNITNAWSLLPT